MPDDRIWILAHHSTVTLVTGSARPGVACSRRILRSVAGGFEDVREVLTGHCSRSTSSIGSSRHSHLERLTEPPDLVESDEAGCEASESLRDIGPALVTDGQASEAVEPCVGSLDHPAMATELLAGLDPASGDARYNPAGAALLATSTGVVGLVGMKLVGTAAWAPVPAVAHRQDRIEGRGHQHAVVAVGPREGEAEGCASGIDDEMALGARLAAIRRVRAGRRAPFLAGTDALSRLARLQSS